MLMAFLKGSDPDFGKNIFEAATKVSSGFALGAFVAAGVVALIWIVNSRKDSKPVPPLAWVVLIVAIVIPVAGAEDWSDAGLHDFQYKVGCRIAENLNECKIANALIELC
jgi:hypothetical protein